MTRSILLNRPTEDYALALVTMEERLGNLPDRQRQTVILHAAGYSLVDIAAAWGYRSKQGTQYLFGQALKGIRE